MNRQELKKALDEFLADKVLQVASLSGSWGVGKTYFWRHYAAKLELDERFNGHCYASLFGADSIDEIRARIAAGMELVRDRKSLANRYAGQVGKLLIPRQLPGKALNVLQLYDKWRKGELAGLASETSYWFVRDAVVCLDDVERLGMTLDNGSLFGIVDELRERGCKVVLLLNRNKLEIDTRKLKNYWEKVVDIDLALEPDVQSNVGIVFEAMELPESHVNEATDLFQRVDCRNIRIHRRAAGVLAAVQVEIADLSDLAQRHVAKNASLLVWALLNPDQSFDENMIIRSGDTLMWFALMDRAEEDARISEAEKEWAAVMDATAYSPAVFDSYLSRYIQTGYLDRSGLRTSLEEFDQRLAQADIEDRLLSSVFSYQNDFTMSQDHYVGSVTAALRDGLEQLSVFQYDQGLSALRRLGQDVAPLCQEFINARGEHLEAVARAEGRDRMPETPALKEEIFRREAAYRSTRFTIDEVAEALRGGDGWSRSQTEFLAAQSVTDYVDWIRSTPPELGRKIRAIQRLGGGNAGPEFEAVSRLENALREIARESDFNADRVRILFNIDINRGDGEANQ